MASSNNYECDRQWKKILPIGFHFVPTDEELIMYLKHKSCNGKIPTGIFNDLDIYQYEPQQLFGFAEKHWDKRMYFFTPLRKKSDKGKNMDRVIHSRKGYWKSSQVRTDLYKNNNIIGTKTSLVYYESCPKTSNDKKTSWLMLEYRFPKQVTLFNNKSDYELTLCVIYYYSRKKNVDYQIAMTAESNDPIPLQSSWSVEYSSLEQYEPPINRSDVASSSSMQPSFSQLIPYGVMDNFDTSLYLNLDNFPYVGDDEIGHISNSNVDSVDQNKLAICVAPISQDDQRPSTDSQDHDHQQLKMKKIKT